MGTPCLWFRGHELCSISTQGISSLYRVFLFVLCLFLAVNTTDSGISPDLSAPLLCYNCTYTEDGDTVCRSNVTTSTLMNCSRNGGKCIVWHFYEVVGNRKETYYFERGCEQNCNAGCTGLDSIENRFVSCVSCCNDPLCNKDSGVQMIRNSLVLIFLCLIPVAWYSYFAQNLYDS